LPRRWLTFFVLAFLLVASFFVNVPDGSAAASGKLIIINKTNNLLAYYDNGQLIKQFKVGTGRSKSLTPEGKFKIVNKIVNRPYYKGKIPGGDPRNPLGNRWLGLNARGTWGTTYAIHGNNNPSSIGGYVSSGCVRMYDEEVEWLFAQVPINTPVIITSSSKSFNAIAAANGFKVTGNDSVAVTGHANGGILKKGSRGSAVRELQRKLTSLGYDTRGTDSIFGINTENALRKFQADHKLKPDGILGPATKKALGI
jgi:L,D-transpeptidase catalytic domain/Putative peptidoglycan binding domain